MGPRAAYAAKNYEIRPKLGRSCRCMLMLGHGYEPVVDFVLILKFSNSLLVPNMDSVEFLSFLTLLYFVFAVP